MPTKWGFLPSTPVYGRGLDDTGDVTEAICPPLAGHIDFELPLHGGSELRQGRDGVH